MTEKIIESFDGAHQKISSILADYITGGYIENLAKLLVYMDEKAAEEILQKLPEEVQNRVSEAYKNLSDKKNTDPEIMAAVLRVLKDADFYGEPVCDFVTADLTSSEKDELLNSTKKLFDKDPFVSLSVEKNLITFNTLLNLDNRAVQKILRETAQEELARALKDADTAVQNKIFINMSKRAANMLKEDIEFIGPVREADINEARDHIISTIIRLSQEGDIVISDLWND